MQIAFKISKQLPLLRGATSSPQPWILFTLRCGKPMLAHHTSARCARRPRANPGRSSQAAQTCDRGTRATAPLGIRFSSIHQRSRQGRSGGRRVVWGARWARSRSTETQSATATDSSSRTVYIVACTHPFPMASLGHAKGIATIPELATTPNQRHPFGLLGRDFR